jgi:SAM-dependent methyltransferase
VIAETADWGERDMEDLQDFTTIAGRYGGYEQQEFIAELYDAANERRNKRDVDFFIDYARQTKGKTLELGCGTGRVLIPTALAGCEITGIDLSAYMLRKCRVTLSEEVEEVQKRVRLMQGNMVDFQTGEAYSLVTMPFRPFQHLISVEEQKACLERVNQQLLPGGRLVLDLNHCFPPAMYDPKYWAEQEIQRDLTLSGGRSLRFTTRIADFHRDQQYNDVELIYYVTYPDGKVERLVQAYPFRYFFRYEVEHLLELCGFKVSDLFGDYDRSNFSNDSPEMIFVAEKQ